MRILHYSLGFPPYRSGGLTKFTMDLMNAQLKQGNQVSLLWPGSMTFFSQKTKIKECKAVKGIRSFELINPLPISYDEGILDLEAFTREGELETYQRFLKELGPDVVHIQTLMGIHKEFLIAAKTLNIRVVFTAHDFFPICPKVTMFSNGVNCPDVSSCQYCEDCNQSALSINKIRILQGPLYRTLKDSIIVKKLRKMHRTEYFTEDARKKRLVASQESADKYQMLREHYKNMLLRMDQIHYNSTVTKENYEKYLGKLPGVIIPLSHGDIKDCRRKKDCSESLRFTYLGPRGGAKGYFALRETLDYLYEEGKKFTLNVFFEGTKEPDYVISHGRYQYSDLEKIFDATDVLVVPSVWNETFGYTVIEALSYGVPVIVSSNVGAKDVIPKGAGIIYDPGTKDALLHELRKLDKNKLAQMNLAICDAKAVMDLKDMEKQIRDTLYDIRGE